MGGKRRSSGKQFKEDTGTEEAAETRAGYYY